MKKSKLLTYAFVGVTTLGLLAACGGQDNGGQGGNADDKPLPTIRIGLHNNLGAGAGYSAYVKGFFKEEGLNAEVVRGTGPNLAADVVDGKLQMSFMGGGVAWHYFRKEQPIKIAALDNLTNDDRLIAVKGKKGDALTINSTLNEVAEALKGSKVALDYAKTPKDFLVGSLLKNINKDRADADKLWFKDPDGKNVPADLTTYTPANQFSIYTTDNTSLIANIESSGADFAIPFAPVSTKLEQNTKKYKTVVTTATHFSDDYQPSTWAVNSKWLAENEALYKKAIRALVKGMNFRRDNVAETCKHIEQVTAGSVMASSLATDIATWLGDKEQLDLYNTGKMQKYTENIRNGKSGHKDFCADVTYEKCNAFSYLIEACQELSKK